MDAQRGQVPVSRIKDVLNKSRGNGATPRSVDRIVDELDSIETAFWHRQDEERRKWEEEAKRKKDLKREAKQERLRREGEETQQNLMRIAGGIGLAVSAVAALGVGARKMYRAAQRELPRSFAKSNYKRIYDNTQVPRFADEMHSATRNFLRAFARQHKLCLTAADEFYERLLASAVSAGGTEEMLDRARRSSYAVRVWTSAETMKIHGNDREFCSLLQQTIRQDGGEDEDTPAREALTHAAVLCRAINEVLCRARGNQSSVTWPSGPNAVDADSWSTEANVTWRGGGLPTKHKWFYEEGKHFRTDMFVATSFHLDVAEGFWRRASEDPIEWKVTFVATKICRHVNFISGVSEVADEAEFLFPPYSVFEVVQVTWSDDLSAEPHRVILKASMDNMHDPEDLPVSPWI